MLKQSIELVEKALRENRKCSTGLAVQQKVLEVQRSDDIHNQEILAYIYADDPIFGYWYGHIFPHPKKAHAFVSAITWSTKLVNAQNSRLLVDRFRYWVIDRLEYEPCLSQHDGDVYAETDNLSAATQALCRMVGKFALELRHPQWDDKGEYHTDLRILSAYGLEGRFDEHGAWNPPPMPSPLSLVKTPFESSQCSRPLDAFDLPR